MVVLRWVCSCLGWIKGRFFQDRFDACHLKAIRDRARSEREVNNGEVARAQGGKDLFKEFGQHYI